MKLSLNGVPKVKQNIDEFFHYFFNFFISKHAERHLDLFSMGWYNFIGKWCGKIAGKIFMPNSIILLPLLALNAIRAASR